LINERWIDENPKYKNGEFSKSYRVSENNYPWVHKTFPVKLQKRIWKKFAGKVAEDKSDLTSYYLNLVFQRHNKLHIPEARSILSKKLKIKLDQNIANVRFAANDRVYSTIIEFDKVGRKDVIFGSYGRLANVDVCGMIQQQLNQNINDPKWDQWIKDDFATRLIEYFKSKKSRDTMKDIFMTAISRKPPHGLALNVLEMIQMEFPLIYDEIKRLNTGSTVQAETQKEEAGIIREFILKYEPLEMIPAHDGVFCGENNALDVQEALERFLKEKGLAGYTKIKPDNLNIRRLTTVNKLEMLFPDN
jgi:hypothetical protein